MQVRVKKYVKVIGCYLVGLLLLSAVFLLEKPEESVITFEESDRPGIDRLFVPIKVESADSIFTSLVNGSQSSVKEKNGYLIIRSPHLKNLLGKTKMGTEVWKELEETDTGLSKDNNELKLSISKDKLTGEEYVNVPAGLAILFVKE